jgi:hypothetical protein
MQYKYFSLSHKQVWKVCCCKTWRLLSNGLRYKELILFMCELINNDISVSDYIALDGGLMNHELERIWNGFVTAYLWHSPSIRIDGERKTKNLVMTATVWADIRWRHLMNMSVLILPNSASCPIVWWTVANNLEQIDTAILRKWWHREMKGNGSAGRLMKDGSP